MKITIKKEVKSQCLDLDSLKPGTVFEYVDGVIGLRGRNSKVVFLLTYGNKGIWFDMANGYLDMPIKKVLGTIEEIIVNPNL